MKAKMVCGGVAIFLMLGCAAQTPPVVMGDGGVVPPPADEDSAATSRAVVTWGATGHQSNVHILEFRKDATGWQSRLRVLDDFDGGMATEEGEPGPTPHQNEMCSAWQPANDAAIPMLDDDAMWKDQRGGTGSLSAQDTNSWPSAECWKAPFTALCEVEAGYKSDASPPGPSTAERAMSACDG